MLRPSLSSFQTTTSSCPGRRWSSILSNSGRLARLPLTPWSVNTLSHPDCFRASICSWVFWSIVLTRAYPILANPDSRVSLKVRVHRYWESIRETHC